MKNMKKTKSSQVAQYAILLVAVVFLLFLALYNGYSQKLTANISLAVETCLPKGEKCQTDSQCCSWVCTSGKCSCRADGEGCVYDKHCCSGNCKLKAGSASGTCGCIAEGGVCADASDCCSGACQNGKCAAGGSSGISATTTATTTPSICQQVGAVCAKDEDCCASLFCNATTKKCQQWSSQDESSTLGQPCNNNSGFWELLDGQMVCVRRQCKANGFTCTASAECCSSQCSGGLCAGEAATGGSGGSVVPACTVAPENCCDGLDNDCDSAIDGLDSDCQRTSASVSLQPGQNNVCWQTPHFYLSYYETDKAYTSPIFSCPAGYFAKVNFTHYVAPWASLSVYSKTKGLLNSYQDNNLAGWDSADTEAIFASNQIYFQLNRVSYSGYVQNQSWANVSSVACLKPEEVGGCSLCGTTGIVWGLFNVCDNKECSGLGDCFYKQGEWPNFISHCYAKADVNFTIKDAVSGKPVPAGVQVKAVVAGYNAFTCATDSQGKCSIKLGLGVDFKASVDDPSYICRSKTCLLNDLKLSSSPFEVVLSPNKIIPCSDTDALPDFPFGKGNYYQKGTAQNTYGVFSDSCSGKTLTEYYCSGNDIISNQRTCAVACDNGACLASGASKVNISFKVLELNENGQETGKDVAGVSVLAVEAGKTCITSQSGSCAIALSPGKYSAVVYDNFYECKAEFACPVSFLALGVDDEIILKLKRLPLQMDYCSDLDGGDNVFEQGAVKWSRSRGAVTGSFVDYCGADNKTLFEGYCDKSFLEVQKNVCEKGCLEGACFVEPEPEEVEVPPVVQPVVEPPAEKSQKIDLPVKVINGAFSGQSPILSATVTVYQESAGTLLAEKSTNEQGLCSFALDNGMAYSVVVKAENFVDAVPLEILASSQMETPLVIVLRPKEQAKTCVDSDGKNYYANGSVVYGGIIIEDKCSGNNIAELYCDGIAKTDASFVCPFGCASGACLVPVSFFVSDAQNNKVFANEKVKVVSDTGLEQTCATGASEGEPCKINLLNNYWYTASVQPLGYRAYTKRFQVESLIAGPESNYTPFGHFVNLSPEAIGSVGCSQCGDWCTAKDCKAINKKGLCTFRPYFKGSPLGKCYEQGEDMVDNGIVTPERGGGVVLQTEGIIAQLNVPSEAVEKTVKAVITPLAKTAPSAGNFSVQTGRTIVDSMFFDFQLIDAQGQEVHNLRGKQATIILQYDEAKVAGINENDLQFHWFDEASQQWKPADKQVIDSVNNTITITVSQL